MKTRGVSQVVGTLFMLAIVAVLGSVLLLAGITNINDFNNFLAFSDSVATDSVTEDLVIEHVRFEPSTTEVSIWIRNTGGSDLVISTVKMVRVDTQELVIDEDLSEEVFERDIVKFEPSVTMPSGCTDWDTDDCEDNQYRLSVMTSKGNFFESVVQPFNT